MSGRNRFDMSKAVPILVVMFIGLPFIFFFLYGIADLAQKGKTWLLALSFVFMPYAVIQGLGHYLGWW